MVYFWFSCHITTVLRIPRRLFTNQLAVLQAVFLPNLKLSMLAHLLMHYQLPPTP